MKNLMIAALFLVVALSCSKKDDKQATPEPITQDTTKKSPIDGKYLNVLSTVDPFDYCEIKEGFTKISNPYWINAKQNNSLIDTSLTLETPFWDSSINDTTYNFPGNFFFTGGTVLDAAFQLSENNDTIKMWYSVLGNGIIKHRYVKQ